MFTLPELASYLQVDDLPEATAALLHELTEDLILDVVGLANASTRGVKAIALEVAARAYRNGDGYQSETVGEYTYRRAEGTGAAGVYLTDAERAALLSLRTGQKSRVRSVRFASVWQD